MNSISTLSPIFEEMLQSGKAITFSPGGISMMPMLHPRTDKVVIVKPDRPVRKHDVVLFKRSSGQLVLHRIVRRRGDRLTLCGDGQVEMEKNIQASQVLGLLKGYHRNDAYIEPKGFKYALYVRTLWQRRIKRRILAKLKK